MVAAGTKKLRFTDRDFIFLVETASPGVSDKGNLIRILREDEDFRQQVGDDELERSEGCDDGSDDEERRRNHQVRACDT